MRRACKNVCDGSVLSILVILRFTFIFRTFMIVHSHKRVEIDAIHVSRYMYFQLWFVKRMIEDWVETKWTRIFVKKKQTEFKTYKLFLNLLYILLLKKEKKREKWYFRKRKKLFSRFPSIFVYHRIKNSISCRSINETT